MEQEIDEREFAQKVAVSLGFLLGAIHKTKKVLFHVLFHYFTKGISFISRDKTPSCSSQSWEALIR